MPSGITAITSLYDRMMPDLPGCPTASIAQATIDVMRDFCIKTECWQETVAQALTEDTVAYTLAPAATDADIRRIKWVKIKSATADDLDDIYETDTYYYTFNGTATLTLNDDIKPTATVATSGLNTRVILVPKINSTTWDTNLMNRWSQAIVAGVKAQLMDNDKESWGNPRRAERFQRDYDTQVAMAKAEYYRDYKTGSLNVIARSWL